MNDAGSRTPSRTAIDTSVLMLFLDLGRTALLKRHPSAFFVTDGVISEVRRVKQRGLLAKALSARHIVRTPVRPGGEYDLFIRMARGRPQEEEGEKGEHSVTAVALARGYALAIQDKGAIREAVRMAEELGTTVQILRIEDIFAELVRGKVLTIPKADAMMRDLEQHHKFRSRIKSIAEVL